VPVPAVPQKRLARRPLLFNLFGLLVGLLNAV
jgi:hypothetical protein